MTPLDIKCLILEKASQFCFCLAGGIKSETVWKITYLNDARILCRSTVTIYDKSLFVIVSRIDSENCEKRFTSCLTFACRDVCRGDT